MQVPMNSGNTIETALWKFTQKLKDDKYGWIWVDSVLWPQNTPCAFLNIDDNIMPDLS